MPKILFYNSFFGQQPNLDHVAAELRSSFSFDRDHIHVADAVVFHVPDLSFGSPYIRDFLSLKKRRGQIWVAWSMESAVNYPVMNTDEFRQRIDLNMDFRRDADIWESYLPWRSKWQQVIATPIAQKTATSPLVMFQSASDNNSNRYEFAERISKHIRLDSYGKVLQNRTFPSPDRGRATKLEVLAQYKFCLSLENAIEDDYVTEKFFDPLIVGTVPVYRGAPNVAEFAPGVQCFIDANTFRSENDLADYLLYLDRDDAAYAEYFAWRQAPLHDHFNELLDRASSNSFERLLRKVDDYRSAQTARKSLAGYFRWATRRLGRAP